MFSFVLKSTTLSSLLKGPINGLVKRCIKENACRFYVDDIGQLLELEKENELLSNAARAANIVKEYADNRSIKKLIDQIENGECSNVLVCPNSAFILDVGIDAAKKIQNRYGVICLPLPSRFSNIEEFENQLNVRLKRARPQFRSMFKREGNERVESVRSWPEFLGKRATFTNPSNAIVINDRYFFSDEMNRYCDGKSVNGCGIYNLKGLLKALLPIQKSGNDGAIFSVCVLCSTESLKNECKKKDKDKDYKKELPHFWDKLRASIEKSVLSNDYLSDRRKFALSVIMVDDAGIKSWTHNRAIYSNYYTLNVEHMLSVFNNPNEGGIMCTQNVYISKLFTYGLADDGDMPVLGHDFMLENLAKWLIDNSSKFERTYFGPEEDPNVNRLFWPV